MYIYAFVLFLRRTGRGSTWLWHGFHSGDTLSHLQGRLGDSVHGSGMLFILILMTVCTLSLFPKQTRGKMHGCSILFPRHTRDKMHGCSILFPRHTRDKMHGCSILFPKQTGDKAHGSSILFILIQGTRHSPPFKATQSPEPGSDPQPTQCAERAN